MVWIVGLLVENVFLYLGNHYLRLCYLLHVPVLLLRYLPPTKPDSCRTNHLHAGDTPYDHSGHIVTELGM